MHVTLVAVMTVNGLIADTAGRYPWASPEDRTEFQKLYTQAGCIVIGRRTYDALRDRQPFPTPGRLCVVVTRGTNTPDHGRIVFKKSPKEALDFLEKEGYSRVLVGGGGILNASFVKEGLVDEIILTIEPVILSRGTRLFGDEDVNARLELKETRKLNNNTVQLVYRIIKNHRADSFA